MNRGRAATALTNKDQDRAAWNMGLGGDCRLGLDLEQLESSSAPGESAGVRAVEEAEFHVEWEGALVASVVSSSVYTVLYSMYTQWCIVVYTQWCIACIHSGI